jgi:hypothetical protein
LKHWELEHGAPDERTREEGPHDTIIDNAIEVSDIPITQELESTSESIEGVKW